jgi:Polysaccharide biosynthesis protein.
LRIFAGIIWNIHPTMADSTLKQTTTVSLFWSFIDKFGQQILNFVSMLILMNIVATEDYGLIGSLTVFAAFSSILIDSGFGRALLNRKNLRENDYSTVFYFNISLSLILYLIFFLLLHYWELCSMLLPSQLLFGYCFYRLFLTLSALSIRQSLPKEPILKGLRK